MRRRTDKLNNELGNVMKEADPDQYSISKRAVLWALVTFPMVFFRFVQLPLLVPIVSIHPGILFWLLMIHIEKMLRDTAEQTGVQFSLQLVLAAPLLSLQEYVLINSIKEAITNALKHGRADAIDVTIEERQEAIFAVVKDNGRGTDEVVYGFGLHAMEERITAIGGRMSVQSGRMEGFILHIQMPVARGSEQ